MNVSNLFERARSDSRAPRRPRVPHSSRRGARGTPLHKLLVVTTLTMALACGRSFADVSAPGPLPRPEEEEVEGCGKARALAARHFSHADNGFGIGRAEAMVETDVLHVELDIEVSNIDPPANSCTLSGVSRMTIQSKTASLTEFTFRLRSQFSVTGAFVNDTVPITVTSDSTTTRTATLDRAYGFDEVFTLTIEYNGDTFSAGFGSIEVATQGGTPVVATLSEAYYAYTWWPAKDGDVGDPGDNSDKFTLEFSITAPDGYEVPANGTLVSVDDLSGNRFRYNWASNYPIATYLVSFAATDYNTWTKFFNNNGDLMPVEFYIYPGNDTPLNRASWERVIDMLGVFTPLFGEYPFINEKYGLYNFPFGGGMEHQTITGQSGFGDRLSSHELAHQWFGDMITCKTWSDIWLNEGFATYSECLWKENETGTPNPSAYLSCMLSEMPSSVGDSVYVYPFETNMARIFSSNFSYRKGAWVLHQLRHFVGDTTFFDILANYRAAFAFSAATTDDFAAVASATYGQDLAWFFDQCVYQDGAPAYAYGWATVNVDGQDYLHVRIAQTQNPSYPDVFIMPVDLLAVVGGGPETVTVWNDARKQWFAVPMSGAVTDLQFDPLQWILRTSASSATYILGDLDEDLDVDGDDAAAFEDCFGVFEPGCAPVDFNADAVIDCTDWNQLLNAWTSADPPPEFAPCPFDGPRPAQPPHDTLKNRYFSFDPNSASASAIRVDMVTGPGAGGALGWVGEPFDPSCENDDGSPNGEPCLAVDYVARVVAAPVFRSWTESMIHLGDCEIAPVATYELRSTADGLTFTPPGRFATIHRPGTWYYADVVGVGTGDLPPLPGFSGPNGVVNVSDVQAFILTAQGDSSPSAHTTWVDLYGLGAGSPPNFLLNVSDLQRILFAQAGQQYLDAPEHVAPADCP